MTLRIGSLCSGYGGLDLAVEAVFDARTAWFCEYDHVPSAILAHHWPHVPNHGDVKTTDWSQVEPVDILTAGYPCQPFSHAGKRKGHDDPRHLWPDVARAIGALRPRLVVLENVRGHVSLGLDAVIGDLSRLGYDARWCVVRAADAGAPHGRARIFIVADPARGPWRVSHGDRVPASDADDERHERSGGARGRRPGSADGDRASTDTVRRGLNGGAPDSFGCEVERVAIAGRSGSTGRWGAYAPAVRRWEHVIGRPAPDPTEPGRNGRPRLAPAFVEWMMGLDAGHVTDIPGLSRNAQLKALGNGVVPQQAALALRLLLADVAVAA